jgi:signal transduction histidine kinase
MRVDVAVGGAVAAEPRRTDRRGANGLRGVVAAVASGIVVVDRSGRVRFANPAACELFGRPLAVLVGTDFGFPVVAGGATDVELRAPDGGARVVEMRVTTAAWNNEGVYVVSLRDVTFRAEAQHELRSALAQIDTTLGSLFNELQIPLATIVGSSRALREGWNAFPDVEKLHSLERIEHAGAEMERLLGDLLAVARARAGAEVASPEVIDVAGLVAGCVAATGEAAVDVRVTCPAGLVAYADPDDVAEIVANYLENSLTYGEPPVDIVGVARDGQVEIRVCDCGRGVPEEFVARPFERFSPEPHAAVRRPDTGQGLSLVASLAQANDGEAWYEPNEPAGACFCVRIPSPADPAPSPSAVEGGGSF